MRKWSTRPFLAVCYSASAHSISPNGLNWYLGVTGAKAGTLTFLVGGNEAAYSLASPILTHMGRRIVHCGAPGSGLVAKICNNLMLGVQQVVTAEAMLLGQRLGIRPDVLADVVGCSTGACWSMSVNNPVPAATPGASPPSERKFEGGFATALMIKVLLLPAMYSDLFLTYLNIVFFGSGHGIGDRECRTHGCIVAVGCGSAGNLRGSG